MSTFWRSLHLLAARFSAWTNVKAGGVAPASNTYFYTYFGTPAATYTTAPPTSNGGLR